MMIFAWIVLSALVGWYSDSRRLGCYAGFFLSLLFSPIIVFIVAFATGKKQTKNTRISSVYDEIKELSSLKNDGFISESEYIHLRDKITSYGNNNR